MVVVVARNMRRLTWSRWSIWLSVDSLRERNSAIGWFQDRAMLPSDRDSIAGKHCPEELLEIWRILIGTCLFGVYYSGQWGRLVEPRIHATNRWTNWKCNPCMKKKLTELGRKLGDEQVPQTPHKPYQDILPIVHCVSPVFSCRQWYSVMKWLPKNPWSL